MNLQEFVHEKTEHLGLSQERQKLLLLAKNPRLLSIEDANHIAQITGVSGKILYLRYDACAENITAGEYTNLLS